MSRGVRSVLMRAIIGQSAPLVRARLFYPVL
jgi:hypothetical protein